MWKLSCEAKKEALAFASYQAAVAEMLAEPPKTLREETALIWPEIADGKHRWNFTTELAVAVRSLAREDLLALFDARVAAAAPQRRKLTAHWLSRKDDAAARGAAHAAAETSTGSTLS